MRRFAFLLSGGWVAVSGLAGCEFSKGDPNAINGYVLGAEDAGVDVVAPPGNDGSSFRAEGFSSFCDAITATPTPLPPEILIVLDRSQSMRNDVTDQGCGPGSNEDCGPQSKWTQMTAAINQAVATSQATTRWGIKFFANGDSASACDVTPGAAGTAVAPALNSAAAISAAIAGTGPKTGTPTTLAETAAADYLRALPDPNPKFILLATDGRPTCNGGIVTQDDSSSAINAVSAAAASDIKTFVVGIATLGTGVADQTLNMMADAGGEAQAGNTRYFPVASTKDLVSVIQKIQGIAALTCTYDLGGQPTDSSSVRVLIDGQQIESSADTWTFKNDNKTIQLMGATCAGVMNMTVQKVEILLPCGVVIT